MLVVEAYKGDKSSHTHLVERSVLTNNGPSTVPETRSGGTRIRLQRQPFVESKKLNITGLAGSKEEE
jgi:hypothetical protein